ncbi:MAG: outer membrane protein assembly factor BamA, partial [Pontibacter sp.]|nr:outer membrane protein assembly factor BamA [Pontibacter sp.]
MTRCIWVLVLLLMAGTASSQVLNRPAQTSPIDYQQPRQYRIAGIAISGDKFLDPIALTSLTGLKEGDMITVPGEDISRAIQNLWDQGILGDVSVQARTEGNSIYLTFVLTESARLSNFRFSGINKSQADALKDKVPLQKGRLVTDAVLNSTRNVVREYYIDKSFLNAKVNITQRPDSVLPNSVVLNIHVDKGNKVKVGDIEIVGNEAFSDRKLERQLKNTKEKRFYKLFTSSKFNRTKFEEDKEALI